MSYTMSMRLELVCSNCEQSEKELELLAEYVEERLMDGADIYRVMQSLAEGLVGLHDDVLGHDGTIH